MGNDFRRREIAVTAAANAFHDAVDRTGKMTMKELEAFGVVSRKTILKHIRAGELRAEKMKVRGLDAWLFEAADAKEYLATVADRLFKAERRRRETQRVAATIPADDFVPAGYVTLAEVSRRSGLSRWTIYDAVKAGRLKVFEGGYKGAKLVPESEAARFAAAEASRARPHQRKQVLPAKAPIRPGPAERRPIAIHDRLVLVMVLLDQPGETVAALARDLGLSASTVGNWSRGVSFPDDENTGRLVAFASGRYKLRFGPELMALARAYRATLAATLSPANRPRPPGRSAAYIADRNAGMMPADIARKHGVSSQSVHLGLKKECRLGG